MQLLRLPEAARQLGVSFPTLKQWIYRQKIASVKTPGGHHRIPRAELDRVLFQKSSQPRGGRPRHPRSMPSDPVIGGETGTGLEHWISGRNQLVGRITALQTVGLLTKVNLDVGGQRITAIITREARRDLGLKVGQTAAALIKATEVMIIRPSAGGPGR